MIVADRRYCAGFTLLELIVALAVITVVMAALHTTGQAASRGGGYLEERTLASWIAANELARLRLGGGWPELGELEGEVTMAHREWRWHARILPTPDPGVRRAELTVSLLLDGTSADRASLTGFLTQ